MKTYDVIIIGAGAAGLFFASSPYMEKNTQDKRLIIDYQSSPGKKLLTTGGGSCNITHSGSIKEFVFAYFENGKKIRSILYKHNNESLRTFLLNNKIKTYTNDEGKVFPTSMDAHEILDTLVSLSKKNGYEFSMQREILSIGVNKFPYVIHTNKGDIMAKKIIIATGGKSFPFTGSDGSMTSILEKSKILSNIEQKAALAPIAVHNYPYKELKGISFQNAEIQIIDSNNNIMGKEVGDILLTSKGFTGPGILNISRYAKEDYKLKISYITSNNNKKWKQDIMQKIQNSKKSPENVLKEITTLPSRFISQLFLIHNNKLGNILDAMLQDQFIISENCSFKNAMATSGGVKLEDVNLKTLELKKHPNIYIIGEFLNIDGKTGGYNLQFAYSSAQLVAATIMNSSTK